MSNTNTQTNDDSFFAYVIISEVEMRKGSINRCIESFQDFYSSINKQLDDEYEKAKEEYKEITTEEDFINYSNMDSYYEEEGIKNRIIYDEFMKFVCTYLYHSFESTKAFCKSIIRERKQSFSNVQQKKIKVFEDFLNNNNVLKELRGVNNCFKHNDGIVSKELSQTCPKWKEGEKIVIDFQKEEEFLKEVNGEMDRIIEEFKKAWY